MADMFTGGSANFDETTGMYKPGTGPGMAPTMPRRKMNPSRVERMAARAAREKAERERDAARKAAREAAKVAAKPVVKPRRIEEKKSMDRKARQAALTAARKARRAAMNTATGASSAGATGMGA